jgi:hypothetical protein
MELMAIALRVVGVATGMAAGAAVGHRYYYKFAQDTILHPAAEILSGGHR